jgi:hypothetical protein
MGRTIRKGVLFTLLFACAVPARAVDPVLMFLFSLARNLVEQRVNSGVKAPDQPLHEVDLARTYPGTAVEPDHLRRLIDDCFAYLTQDQRREVFEQLHAGLMDPRNAAVRGYMIEYFAHRALAVRAAQIRLAQLSSREKEMLAAEFRATVAGLPEEERAQLSSVLARGLLPVPDDLNGLLAAALQPQ